VILRTEYQAPREHLAERLNLSYEDLVHIVFESETARRAALGEITEDQHWQSVAAKLGRSDTQIGGLRDEFFGGDVLDRGLLDFIRGLRRARRTGLLSNGWLDLRKYLVKNRIQDAFDSIVISAEVGMLKPDPRVYQLALKELNAGPKEAVFVDDTPANVQAAAELGMCGVLFTSAEQTRREVEKALA